MSDLKSNHGRTEAPAHPEKDVPDIARRRAVTYFAMGVGLAAAGFLTPRRAEASYGRCYKCNCCGFEGNENNCSNCGHQFSDHGGQTCLKGDGGAHGPAR